MGHLPFAADAELTGPDRVVLEILRKEYELHGESSKDHAFEPAADSDDSATKHSKFVSPSPEGNTEFLVLDSGCT